MTALVWDNIGERFYETGVDRGVLYLPDGSYAAWNGLIGVEDNSTSELQSFYYDGVKYLNYLAPAEFSGKLKAFTYPDLFDSALGISSLGEEGFFVHEQPPKSFSLTYRTKIGNDVDGIDHGYKIHILYNLLASPESIPYDTISDSTKPIEFSWSLTGTPARFTGFKPAVHVSIDSTKTIEPALLSLEETLYGTESTNPDLPTSEELMSLISMITRGLLIVDNEDGTWDARDESNAFINMLSSTEFEITGANTTTIDPDTYTISDTEA